MSIRSLWPFGTSDRPRAARLELTRQPSAGRDCQGSVPQASWYSGLWSQLESGSDRDCIPHEERATA